MFCPCWLKSLRRLKASSFPTFCTTGCGTESAVGFAFQSSRSIFIVFFIVLIRTIWQGVSTLLMMTVSFVLFRKGGPFQNLQKRPLMLLLMQLLLLVLQQHPIQQQQTHQMFPLNDERVRVFKEYKLLQLVQNFMYSRSPWGRDWRLLLRGAFFIKGFYFFEWWRRIPEYIPAAALLHR